jgi:proteasome lid subunit RPN8/RPN11
MTGPDVRQLAEQQLPQEPFPAAGTQPFRLYFAPAVHANVWEHARADKGVEICGVLVGKWGRDAGGPFVAVSETIRGEAATNKFAEVTFTHETWARINAEMDSKYANLAIVGWYHSHPDFGVFLSDRDRFIQQHFFSGPGQLAYVVDPVRETEGVFIWKEGQPALAPCYWVGDRPCGSELATRSARAEEAAATPGAAARAPAGPPWYDRALPWLALLAMFLLGWLLAGYFQAADRERVHHQAIAETALWLGVKPGLKEALDRSLADLDGVAKDLDVLVKAAPPAEGEEGNDQRARWEAARGGLRKVRQEVRALQADYCLTPAQTERLLRRTADTLAALAPGLSREERIRLSQRLEQSLLQDILEGRPKAPEGQNPKPDAAAPKGEGKAQ